MAPRPFRTNSNEAADEKRLENEIKQIRDTLDKCSRRLFTLSVQYFNKKPRTSHNDEIYRLLNEATTNLMSADLKLMPLDPEGAEKHHYNRALQAEYEGYMDEANFHFFEAEKYRAEVERRKRS